MWFKNLFFFRLTEAFDYTPESLGVELAEHAFRECGSLEMSSFGWVPSLGRGSEELVHSANGCLLITACKQDKLLPASVVNERVHELVVALEAEEARKVRKQEKAAMRDDVTTKLLPQALTRKSLVRAYIDPKAGWIVVDAASANKAEELVNQLRESLGSLRVVVPDAEIAPSSLMTQWVNSGTPGDFELEQECEMHDPAQEKSVIRCRGLDLTGSEIEAHMKAGKVVTKLALVWGERIAFILCDNLQIKRLKFLDLIQDEAEQVLAETEAERLDADFAIMVHELRPFIQRLADLFEVGRQKLVA